MELPICILLTPLDLWVSRCTGAKNKRWRSWGRLVAAAAGCIACFALGAASNPLNWLKGIHDKDWKKISKFVPWWDSVSLLYDTHSVCCVWRDPMTESHYPSRWPLWPPCWSIILLAILGSLHTLFRVVWPRNCVPDRIPNRTLTFGLFFLVPPSLHIHESEGNIVWQLIVQYHWMDVSLAAPCRSFKHLLQLYEPAIGLIWPHCALWRRLCAPKSDSCCIEVFLFVFCLVLLLQRSGSTFFHVSSPRLSVKVEDLYLLFLASNCCSLHLYN